MARIANLAMMEFAIIRAFLFPHSTAALALREKMKPQPRFKAFASILPEHFIADFARGRICSKRSGRAKNRSKSRFILRGRRKKFPNANPKAESSPNHFDFPVISYYFPPFSVSKLLGNVGRQIRAARLSAARNGRIFACSDTVFTLPLERFLRRYGLALGVIVSEHLGRNILF